MRALADTRRKRVAVSPTEVILVVRSIEGVQTASVSWAARGRCWGSYHPVLTTVEQCGGSQREHIARPIMRDVPIITAASGHFYWRLRLLFCVNGVMEL